MADNNKYKCTLSPEDEEFAKKELNESDRIGAVTTFRNWIKSNPHIKCPTAKFSQLRARSMLQSYLTMKTQNPTWYNNIDTTDPKVVAVFKSGSILPLGFDKLGRYVMMFRIGSIATDDKHYDQAALWRALFALLFHILHSEKALVRGIAYIYDFTDFEMKHITYWGLETMKKALKIYQGSLFGRFKGYDCYNTGNVFESMMKLISTFMSQKMKDRVHIHGNLETLYKTFSKDLFPEEYLPDDYDGPSLGSISSIADKLIKDLAESSVHNRIAYESKEEWGIDLSKIPSDVPSESFRKLNVD